MQRLLSLKQTSSTLTKALTKTSSSSSGFNPPLHNTFSPIANPIPTPQNHFLSTPFSHPFHHLSFPWRSKPSLKVKTQGFLSYPVVAKRFWLNSSNTHLKVSGKSLLDSKAWFLRPWIPKGRFDVGPSFGLSRSRWRSWFQQFTESQMVLCLILTNVAVFLLWRIADQEFMMNNFMVSLDNFKSGRLHTLITSAFSHIDIKHIVTNMIGLYFFGHSIESIFGPQYLLKLYLSGAIVGSLFYLVHHAYLALSYKFFLTLGPPPQEQAMWMDPETPGLGASGAVNAILLLDIFLNPKSTLYLDFIIPVPAMLLGIFLIGIDIWRTIEGNGHVSGSAHLGGAAVAAIAWARHRRGRF